MTRLAAILVLASLSIPVPAYAHDKKKDPTEIGDRNVSKGLNFYTLDQELALGKQLAIEVEKQAKIVDDPIISEYINRLGQNLARNSDVTFPVTFKLIEADELVKKFLQFTENFCLNDVEVTFEKADRKITRQDYGELVMEEIQGRILHVCLTL